MSGPTGPTNITEKALIASLKEHAGVFVLVARQLGCDRSNITHRVARSKKLQAVVQEIEDEVGDIAVGVIRDALLKKDRTMARWYAGMKLKDRGFSTRTEITGKDGAALPAATVNVVVEYVDAPRRLGDDVGDVV